MIDNGVNETFSLKAIALVRANGERPSPNASALTRYVVTIETLQHARIVHLQRK